MPLTTTKLIHHWKAAQRDEQNKIAKPPSFYLRCALIASLSYTEREVFEYIAKRSSEPRRTVSSHDVADEFALSLNHALNILNRLHQYGLVTKERNVKNAYREYLWSVADKSNGELKQ